VTTPRPNRKRLRRERRAKERFVNGIGLVVAFVIATGLMALRLSHHGHRQSVDAARTVATREFTALEAKNWRDAWALWSASAQAAVSAEDFARWNDECGIAAHGPYVVKSAAAVDPDQVEVSVSHLGFSDTFAPVWQTEGFEVVKENGQWRFVPPSAWRTGCDDG
jgi:hypothetical protein